MAMVPVEEKAKARVAMKNATTVVGTAILLAIVRLVEEGVDMVMVKAIKSATRVVNSATLPANVLTPEEKEAKTAAKVATINAITAVDMDTLPATATSHEKIRVARKAERERNATTAGELAISPVTVQSSRVATEVWNRRS